MSRIQPLEPASASPKAQELLAAVKAKIGMTPNLMKTLAQSAPALEGYLNFSGALAGGVLAPKLREQIAITVAQINSCQYCLSAHTMLGKMAGLSKEELAASRRANSIDPKSAVALQFAQNLVVHKGQVTDEALASLRVAGFSEAEIVEIVSHVALNIFTNYFNNVAQTVVDFPAVDLALAA